MISRRRFAAMLPLGAACFAGSGFFSASAWAQKASCSPLRLVVPFPPGGGGDVLARFAAEHLSRRLGRKVWIDNRPGAGGTIGAKAASAAKPDGQTLAYVTNGILCVNPLLYRSANFDAAASLAPVGQLSSIGLIGVLNPDALPGVSDLPSLIAYAKDHPGAVNFASSGSGTTSHLAGLFFAERAGLKLAHVPYKGGAAAILDVLAGRIPFMIDVAPNVIGHIASGKLKALGAASKARLAVAPDVPTFEEGGLSGFELSAWDGIAAPLGTPEAVLDALSEALADMLAEPDVRAGLARKGAEPGTGRRADFSDFIAAERPKWASLVRAVEASAG